MQRYESYKPSAIPWIDELPQHWGEEKGKWLHRFRKDLNNRKQCDNVLSLTLRGVVNNDPDDPEGLVPKDYGTYQIFEKDDLVFKLIDLENFRTSRVGLVHERGIMSPAYLRVQPGKEHNPRYFYYYYFTLYQQGIYNKLGAGVRSTLGPTDLLEIGVPVPSKEEQDRLVAFLDQKTAEIDAAIVKKERLIEVLTEQRQTLINQAVTAGLDQTVPQHYSGVEWIGDIPSGWGVVPVTKYTKSIVDYRGKTPEKVASGVFLVTAKNIKKGQIDYAASTEFVSEKDYPKIMARGLPEIGDLLFTTEAPLGEVALVDRTDVAFAQRIIKLRLDRDRLLPKFVVYAMSARYFQTLLAREATGSTALGIKASKLHKLKIAAPSLGEQNRIVEYLDEAGEKIQELQSRIQGEIENLRELKKNTVASCVTGLFKV